MPPDSYKFYNLKVAEAGKICCVENPYLKTIKTITLYTKPIKITTFYHL